MNEIPESREPFEGELTFLPAPPHLPPAKALGNCRLGLKIMTSISDEPLLGGKEANIQALAACSWRNNLEF